MTLTSQALTVQGLSRYEINQRCQDWAQAQGSRYRLLQGVFLSSRLPPVVTGLLHHTLVFVLACLGILVKVIHFELLFLYDALLFTLNSLYWQGGLNVTGQAV
jgi:hypothetical protein